MPCTRTAGDDPYLVVLEVKDTKGEPIKNAVIDAWHANGTGGYYFFSWTLRGKMTTDANGRLELLTIRPGGYAGRASHIHIRIYPTESRRHRQMTSQMYMCDGNDPVHMSSDIANKWRRRPDGNMVTCWATGAPEDGKAYHGLPKLPEEDVDMADAVSRWNVKLEEQGVTKKIMSVGRHQVKITAY
uniref:TonB-dependent hemoglobin/transferrin/lactoferrin family receptor (Transferrin-binding protein A) (Vep20) n=1 Tax=Ganoderma boninense TaxID=34458 RepID=A0A5K1K767_9APHY|nr:TonB-dependent hemoglobin/transferrin/lactoferrin family receptor (Transferrin-binding protein A) (Vep20) [Ganoderma boninense]